MNKKNFWFVMILCALVELFCAVEFCRADATNTYDDWAHFGLGGCFGGMFSLIGNSPYQTEDLWIHEKKNDRYIYAGRVLKARKNYDLLPGILGGLAMEGLNWLRHPNYFNLEHAAFGMGGAVIGDFGTGVIFGLW